MKLLSTLIALIFAVGLFAQKKEIDHTVYDQWKSVHSARISNNGNVVVYEINPHKGDGWFYIYNIEKDKLDSFPRGKQAQISGNSSFAAFMITPGYDTLRTCELDKVDKKKWPKDSLGIYLFEKDTLLKFPEVTSFDVNDESDWMTITYHDNGPSVKPTKKKRRFLRKEKEKEVRHTSDGHRIEICNPIEEKTHKFNDVTDHTISKYGDYVALAKHQKSLSDSAHFEVFSTVTEATYKSEEVYQSIAALVFDERASQLALLTSKDTVKEKTYAINLFDIKKRSIKLIADTNQTVIPEGDAVSKNFKPRFTKDGQHLYFGVGDQPVKAPEDTLTKAEKVELDLWHYEDKRLQPQQLIELERDEKRTNLYVHHLKDGTTVQLSSDTLTVRPKEKMKGKRLLGMSNERYAHTYNWTIPYPEDYYQVSFETGETRLIAEGVVFGGALSPEGKFFTYYKNATHNHYAINLDTKEETCLTCSIDNVNWESDVNGMPSEPRPIGLIGWKKGEDKVYIQSEFDIWEYDFITGDVSSITHEEGAANNIKISLHKWSYDSVYVDFETTYATGFDRKTKGKHFYHFTEHDNHVDLNELAYYDANVIGIVRSKDKSQMILQRMTAIEYPDVQLADQHFRATKKISFANPQQSEYNWTTVELVKWKSYEGKALEGLLYKPENYDPHKKYPLMVYFYELYSDRFHTHYIPKPTASIVYATEYTSAGYLLFIPDIRYEPGHPAKSAYDCIMSGTDHILKTHPNVDSTRMALQGQSWGGYQTAQLITMTNRYKAAMAGAPVANMFSAYGGIRWKSGLNRQFQYERTQSRIGYTIWDRPDLYVENSPLFHLPKVSTPLLIMHNDNDGAVPWYQGIELFTGLKRLGKPAWLLNYNGDNHNLMRNANRMDLSIRMRQFFDHYLLDKKAPQWLLEGIPATVKGKELRY